MPQPTPGDVHVDAALSNISVAYVQSQDHAIARKVFPRVPSAHRSGKYFKYTKEDMLRSVAEKRGPGSASVGGGYNLTSETYFCDVFAVHKDVDDQTRANQDAAIDMDRDAATYVAQQLLMKEDLEWASAFFTTSTWTGSTTGGDITPGTLWSAASSTPIQDIRAQATSILKNTGKRPNKLVLGVDVFDTLAEHADILDKIKYTQEASVTEMLLARLLGVDEVLVARLTNTTSAEGAASQTQSFICNPKDALLVYAASSPSLLEPSGGYTFTWDQFGAQQGMRTKSFRMEPLASDRIEGELAFDHKLVAPDVGAYFDGAVA
jgi:hypothetical protein